MYGTRKNPAGLKYSENLASIENPIYPYGKPVISGLLKSAPEDFKVTENPGFEPSGDGEHLFLWIEKAMLATHELIERVARDFSVKAGDIEPATLDPG